MSDISVYSFSELSPVMLYDILKLRQDVFIVEQKSAYQDLDNLDPSALHLLIIHENILIAYCRIIPNHPVYASPAIGRIVVRPSSRGQGLGKILINEALGLLKSQGYNQVMMEAQEHLEHYYNSFGFSRASESYDAEGIPHIKMKMSLK